MATTDPRPRADVRPWKIAPPDKDEMCRMSPDIRYAPSIDSVFVYFYGSERPAVSMVLDENLTAMVDPKTDQLVGFEIDHFLSEAVLAHPTLEPLLDLEGMPARRVKQIRKQLDPESRRKMAIGSLIEQLTRQATGDNGL